MGQGTLIRFCGSENRPLTQYEARDILRKLCPDSNICVIKTLRRKERNSIIESALEQGVGVRQLARLTGISFAIIQRINEKEGQRTVP